MKSLQPGWYRSQSADSGRGRHPDLDDDGNLLPEAIQWADPAERDFNRRFARDQHWAAAFMERVAERQSQEPEWIQRAVAGETFGAGRGAYAGFSEYQQELARLRADQDRYHYGDGVTVVRDHEIEAMSLEDFDRHFDANGRPKPGVVVEHGNRSVALDDGIDPASRGELRGRSR